MRDSPLSIGPSRRDLLRGGIVGGAALGAGPLLACASRTETTRAPEAPAAFELDELGVAELQAAMTEGRSSARRLAELYLERIEAVDRSGPGLRSILETNPDALAIADALDAERRSGKLRGALHGIPVLLKDNIDTADAMQTSAGSLALVGAPAREDAGLVRRLREAGALILAKTNLSEWANIRSSRSTSGWSARGGLTRNPYALDRNTSGSSSGTAAAIAASLGTLGIGTETDGSILSPSNMQGLVGIKPTVGLVSRSGIVPISHSQDTAGPMCRTVRDAATLLGAIAGPDARDSATAAAEGRIARDYAACCDPAGLVGARIGVARQLFNAGPLVDDVMELALAALSDAGAILVDPVEISTLRQLDAPEFEVLLFELKAGLERYLATRGPDFPYKSLADLIRFNMEHGEREMPFFGQELFLRAQMKGTLDSPEYHEALAKCRRLSREQGLDQVLAQHQLDALVAPSGSPAWVSDLVNGDHFVGGSSTLSAVAGYPAITVPAGMLFGLPVGISFMGAAWSEAKLIQLAYGFEQATRARRAPRFLASAELPGN